MEVFLITFLVFSLAFTGLALGWLIDQKVLKGSCGGLSAIPGISSDCSCAKPCEKRLQREKLAAQNKQQNTLGEKEHIIEFRSK